MSVLIGTLLFISGSITTLIILGSSVIKDYISDNKTLKDINHFLDKGKLKFHSRLEDIVYIKGYKQYTIVYSIKGKSISLLDGINPISTHNKTTLSDKIEKEFFKEINNITTLCGHIYSKNILTKYDDDSKKSEKDDDPKIDHMDTILDQISSDGIESDRLVRK